MSDSAVNLEFEDKPHRAGEAEPGDKRSGFGGKLLGNGGNDKPTEDQTHESGGAERPFGEGDFHPCADESNRERKHELEQCAPQLPVLLLNQR